MTSAAPWRKASRLEWKFNRTYVMATFEVVDIKWIERFPVGVSPVDGILTQGEINKQMAAVNLALRYGTIVAIEQNFTTMAYGNKDTLAQYTVYHVGFKHRPPGK